MASKHPNKHHRQRLSADSSKEPEREPSIYRDDMDGPAPVSAITLRTEYWLEQRGYDEAGLQNEEQEGMYQYYLRDQVRDALDRNPNRIGTESFFVMATGFQGEGEERVPATFRFHYALNCETDYLSIQHLDVTMEGMTIRYSPKKIEELPNIQDCYQQIALQKMQPADKRLQIARQIISPPPTPDHRPRDRRLRPLR